MKITSRTTALTGLAFFALVNASKGKSEVQACVHQANELSGKNYTVNWSAGQSTDACMKRRGKKASMLVTKPGITCVSLGDVEVNDDSWCYWQQSRWGMSYNVDGKSWSGSTDSRWFTGPVHTEIELRDSSAGTVVCGGPALCDAESKEWRNDGNDAIYIIFKPTQFGKEQMEL
ncbi:hypothetical protein B5807_03072 [Epicoccum nigrum]|uniref:Ig-like domain-containing protein n=1 Tax=Epicoccum nigrum TaxID=105696 RepID=A0A1Y2MAD3_EPING|nr:hypothetical protein B5807_03072 [Epicoccum nigrum]